MEQLEEIDEEIFRLRDELEKTMPTSSNQPHSSEFTELRLFPLDKVFYCNFCPKAFDTQWERREHNQTEYEGKNKI